MNAMNAMNAMNVLRGKLFVKEKVLLPDKITNGKAYFENGVLLVTPNMPFFCIAETTLA